MNYTVIYDSEIKCVVYTFIGSTSTKEINDATEKGISLAKINNAKLFFVDASQMIVTSSVVDLIQLPEEKYFIEKMDRDSLIILLLPEHDKSREQAEFYETVCLNRGWFVKSFKDKVQAINYINEFNKV